MARDTTLLQQRNNYIRLRFRYHRKKNPKWTMIAVIDKTAEEAFLSSTTVGKILKEADIKIPSVNTIIKYTGHYCNV